MLGLGWRSDIEERERLHSTAVDWKPPAAFSAPEEFDPRPIIAVEQQGSVGSCAGHALTSSVELCEYLKTGGNKVHLNRMFSYVIGQRESGIQGDQGATITGVVNASKRVGVCREELWPYTGRYDPNPPRECFDEAANHRIQNHAVLRSYRDVLSFLQAGQGAVVIGIAWTEGLANNRSGQITSRNAGGRNFGGHAITLAGWNKDGWIWLGNSHGQQWGQGGWALCEPEWIERQCRDQMSEFIGVSDLTEDFGKARKLDWTDSYV